MSKAIAIVSGVAVVLVAAGVGGFFIVKNLSEEQHKKDIEMAADCARTFEKPVVTSKPMTGGFVDTGAYETFRNNRNAKRQECAEKYHVTHQEIIDKIGTENYSPR